MRARWPSGLERWLGLATGRSRSGSNPTSENFSLRNFGNSVYPVLPVSFGGDTKSRRSLLSGVYSRGSKISHQSALECVTQCRGLHHSERRIALKITLSTVGLLKFDCSQYRVEKFAGGKFRERKMSQNSIRSGYYFRGRKISRKIEIRENSENLLHAKNWCYLYYYRRRMQMSIHTSVFKI